MGRLQERILLLGFGEVGQALFDELEGGGQCRIEAFDIQFDDPASGPSRVAAKKGLSRHQSLASAMKAASGSDQPGMVLCAVTAAADLDAAEQCAALIPPGTLYADLNSASPGVKQQAADTINNAGGSYVEVAVMSPIDPKRLASPMLLGGPFAQTFLERTQPLGFTGGQVHASEKIGAASATKMCRSVVIKGVEALLTESMLAARHYGVEDGVLDSLSNLLPADDWRALTQYMISRSIEHGGRRAEEMREVVKTVEDAGVDPWMSAACVERQAWAPQHAPALSEEALGIMLDVMLARRGT
ncbi:MAG: DUF1932 domain-containing protein [Burkholderiaceae bacterium]